MSLKNCSFLSFIIWPQSGANNGVKIMEEVCNETVRTRFLDHVDIIQKPFASEEMDLVQVSVWVNHILLLAPWAVFGRLSSGHVEAPGGRFHLQIFKHMFSPPEGLFNTCLTRKRGNAQLSRKITRRLAKNHISSITIMPHFGPFRSAMED